jgi:hypothetical protein
VAAWGEGMSNNPSDGNNYGQSMVPAGLTNVVAIAAGGYHSLALVGSGPPVVQVTMANPSFGTNGFSVSLTARSGRVYRLEYKTALTNGSWTALPPVAGVPGALRLSDPTATGSGARFARVQRW